ncbi:MAG TPA: type IV toxin-antitoxin system AbiEi family antitoxin domain-containing protein, partial [Propionibacteriaceae bacterium]|nr:type IV toxin-antitoxin system AbiEi family antitoxin domain-containing protein [Propionibacteriaceae bacterium]
MHARQVPSPDLRRLADWQDGVLTREQALAHQLSPKAVDRLVTDGHWRRLTSGLYLTAATDPTWRALAWAGVLAGGDAARLGG